MYKKTIIFSVVLFILLTMVSSPANAAQQKDKDRVDLVYKVVTKLMSKGDEAVISIGRILKAEAYFKQLKNPTKAIEELDKLEKELKDPELLFAANTIKILILKETEKDPAKFISHMDKIIASAKERLAQK